MVDLRTAKMVLGSRYEIHTTLRTYSGEYDGVEKCGTKPISYVKLKGNRGKHILLSEKIIQSITEVQ